MRDLIIRAQYNRHGPLLWGSETACFLLQNLMLSCLFTPPDVLAPLPLVVMPRELSLLLGGPPCACRGTLMPSVCYNTICHSSAWRSHCARHRCKSAMTEESCLFEGH